MKASHVLLLLGVCALLAYGARVFFTRSPAKPAKEETRPGADSVEQLKDRFLALYEKNDTQGMLGLFFLKGASQQMVDLYRNGLPEAKLTNTSATIEEISDDRKTTIVHTLTPEKVLLLKFSRANQGDPIALEQFFRIGRQKGRYYFTLPTGE